MFLQRAMWITAGLYTCLLAGAASASPPGRLHWSKATITVHPSKRVGPVQIEMECPGGQLKSLSISTRDFKASVPMSTLKKLNLPNTCSGADTQLISESESSTEPIGFTLNVFMSSEYEMRELELFVSFEDKKFTGAKYVVTPGGRQTQVEKVEF